MRVRRMPMHLSSGNGTLMPETFYPLPPIYLPVGLRAPSRLTLALPQISSFFFLARDLGDAWADRREILHDGQYEAQFSNASLKI